MRFFLLDILLPLLNAALMVVLMAATLAFAHERAWFAVAWFGMLTLVSVWNMERAWGLWLWAWRKTKPERDPPPPPDEPTGSA